MPGIVVAFGGYQSSRIGVEGSDFSSFSLNLVDALHGTHVVNARVEANLVHKNEGALACFVAKTEYLFTDVTGSDHVLAERDAVLRNLQVHLWGQKRYHYIVAGNDFAAVVWLGGIEPNGAAMGMVVHLTAGQFDVSIRNGNEKIVAPCLFEDIIDESGGRAACADNEEIFHKWQAKVNKLAAIVQFRPSFAVATASKLVKSLTFLGEQGRLFSNLIIH